MTKICVYYLEAIENGEFQKLPGRIYAKSYIRQYAIAIDFDPDELLKALPPDSAEGEAPREPLARALLRRFYGFAWLTFLSLKLHGAQGYHAFRAFCARVG